MSRLALLFGVCFTCGLLATAASAGSSEVVAVPWRPGNADAFQLGTVAQHGLHAAQGELSVTLYRPDGAGPCPFVVLVTPVRYCEQMQRSQPPSAAPVTLVVYPYAPHTFDMNLPDRVHLRMRLGYDAEAAAASKQVIEFLSQRGIGREGRLSTGERTKP